MRACWRLLPLLLLPGCNDILSWMMYSSLNGIEYIAVEQACFPNRSRPREENGAPFYRPEREIPTLSLRLYFSSSRPLDGFSDLDFTVMYTQYVVGDRETDWSFWQAKSAREIFYADGQSGRHALPGGRRGTHIAGSYAYYAYVPVSLAANRENPAHDLAEHPEPIRFLIGSPQIWVPGPKSNVIVVPQQDVVAALAGKRLNCTAPLPPQVPSRADGPKGRT